jgi:4-amino-4-deoxy-L-arabinose transferase-like glycosyltransferase
LLTLRQIRRSELAVFLLLLLVATALRSTAFLHSVINPDESLYAVQAQAWLRGGWPYVAVWDMHPVGAPALIAATFSLLGETMASVRLVGILAVAATGYALHAAVRAAGGGRAPALAAGMLYVSCSILLDGLATNTEILLAPFVAAAVALGLRDAAGVLGKGEAPSVGRLVLAGLAIGVALLIKSVAFPQGCMVFLLFVIPGLRLGRLPLRRLAGRALLYALCCAAPTALVAVTYAVRGEFAAFVDACFSAPLRYVAMATEAPRALRQSLAAAATLLLPLLMGLAALVPAARRSLADRLLLWTGLAWFIAASIAVILPGMYFQHYFLLLLGPVALLAALGTRRLVRLARPGAVLPVFAGLLLLVMLQSWAALLMPRLERGIGLRAPDPPQQVAAVLKAAWTPGDSLFVVNWQPLLYFLVDAPPPSRFSLPAQLTGPFANVIGIDPDAELARILAKQPKFLVVDRGSWTGMRQPAQALVAEALTRDYSLFATVPSAQSSTVEIWRRR